MVTLFFLLGFAVAHECGFDSDCPRDYALAAVNESAALLKPDPLVDPVTDLASRHRTAVARCSGGRAGVLRSGGWCLDEPSKGGPETSEALELAARQEYVPGRRAKLPFAFSCSGGKWVWYPSAQTYFLPRRHVVADDVVVSTLIQLLAPPGAGRSHLTLLDFGAGVGQYGRALIAAQPQLARAYRGFDGAGNVENVTKGFVRFFDLTTNLALGRSDWVMSIEVGEHVSHRYEEQLIRNLHAHNCRGIVLSWAKLFQQGVAHVNCHSESYLRALFQELGYRLDEKRTAEIRGFRLADGFTPPTRMQHLPWYPGQSCVYHWMRSAMVFERITPVSPSPDDSLSVCS
jgi:hypothetical protein